jgi:hypothetical protein
MPSKVPASPTSPTSIATITIVCIMIGEEKKTCRLLEVKAAHVKAKRGNDGGSWRKSGDDGA